MDHKICITVSDAEMAAVAAPNPSGQDYTPRGMALYRFAAACREALTAREAKAADEHEAAQGDGDGQ